jgi:hypothetical protein
MTTTTTTTMTSATMAMAQRVTGYDDYGDDDGGE